jgi:hypothetical protein
VLTRIKSARSPRRWLMAMVGGALFVTAVGCTAGPAGDGDGDPEPDTDVVTPESPWREDFDSAFDALDPEIQELAVSVEAGALAGTFAMRAVSSTLVDTGILGTHRGGGVNHRLLTRVWNEEEQVYDQQSVLCGGFNFETAGVTTGVEGTDVYRAVADSTEVVRVDPDSGVLLADGHLQLWGMRDLPEPATTPLPETIEEAMESPWVDEYIFDMDDDGEMGITLYVDGENAAGSAQGVIYAIQRKQVRLTGVTTSPDRAVGWVETTWESLALGSEPDLLQYLYLGSATPHPDQDLSWFEIIRVDDGSDCDDVEAFIDSGAFALDVAPW